MRTKRTTALLLALVLVFLSAPSLTVSTPTGTPENLPLGVATTDTTTPDTAVTGYSTVLVELPMDSEAVQTINWATGNISGFTRQMLLQSDGHLYFESSAPLIPQDWSYGLILYGEFNGWDWDAGGYRYIVDSAVGVNAFSLPLNEHPLYDTMMNATGNFAIVFYTWHGDVVISERLTRAYFQTPNDNEGWDELPIIGDPMDFITIDQFGYRPSAQKIAVIRNPKRGIDSASSFSPGYTYQIINEATGAAVYSGTPELKFTDDISSGDQIWWFDFSAVTQAGRYYVFDQERDARSFSFTIGEDVYNEVLKHAVRMFYYQRMGTAKETPYADPRWTDAPSYMHDEFSRFYLAPDNTALQRDLRGGWFDAGDYNKYTAWAADYIEGLMSVYRERPEVFTDDYNIPESGNGVPDILDEARWGMDWLLKMQNDNSVNYSSLGIPLYPTNITNFDGSVLSIVGYGAAGGSPPSTDNAANAPSRYGPPNTIGTLHAAKAFALGAIVFAEFDPAYAARLQNAAISAFNWASDNPEVYFHNNSSANNSEGLGAGDQEPSPDGEDNSAILPRLAVRMMAGLYLYELTGENQYLQIFEQDEAYKRHPLFAWWENMDMYRFDTHRLYLHYLTLSGTSSTARNSIINNLRLAFHSSSGNYASRTQSSGYLAYMDHYPWGSNSHASNIGSTFYYFSQNNIVSGAHTADTHLNAAENYLHYIHGVNPLSMVYLTNMNDYGATKSASVIYHSWFSQWYRDITTQGPPPGYLPGGPNGGFNVDSVFPSNLGGYGSSPNRQDAIDVGNKILAMQGGPPAKMYVDSDHSWPINTWEITEPMGAYQLSYIRLLSKFVSQPQAQQTHTVTFAFSDGVHTGGELVQEVPHGGTVQNPPVVSRVGFALLWSGDLTNITGDRTITAEWIRSGAVSTSGEGYLSSAEVVWLARHVAGHAGFGISENDIRRRLAADVNRDGVIDAADISTLLRWLVGYEVF